MSDPFSTFSPAPNPPARRLRLVTPNDGADLPIISRLFCTGTGFVTCIPVGNADNEPVTLIIDEASMNRVIPLFVRRVMTGPAGKTTRGDCIYAVEA